MKFIRECAESAMVQGLKCVQFRLPSSPPLRPEAYTCALGLRYGLVGGAAAYYALDMSEPGDERELRFLFQYWPHLVTEHFRGEVAHRVPFDTDDMTAITVGKLAGGALKVCIALRRQLLPLERVLEISSEVFRRNHRREITADMWLLKRRGAAKQFHAVADESIRYAANFFDRRQAGLPEVSEIVLLGE